MIQLIKMLNNYGSCYGLNYVIEDYTIMFTVYVELHAGVPDFALMSRLTVAITVNKFALCFLS